MAMANDLMVSGAFARASAFAGAKSGVAYFTLMNHGREPDRLIEIKTSAASRASLHETVEENGVAQMREVKSLDVPAGGMVELGPNGLHVMLMGLAAPLKKGEQIRLTLVFDRSGEMDVDVPIGEVAAMDADHSSHSGASSGN